MNLYSEDNLENILMYNQLFYNLLSNKLHENEIILFIEEVVNLNNEVKNVVVTDELLNNDVDMDIKELVIDVTNNKLSDEDIYVGLRMIFKSHNYDYEVVYDFRGRRFIVINF